VVRSLLDGQILTRDSLVLLTGEPLSLKHEQRGLIGANAELTVNAFGGATQSNLQRS
jgi:hypothetical protein